ncbi:alpha/beta hydrolase [Candidatus Synechococcus calcipolaris G9]|uniref:Alpha/beta hydrolase n=1 Tax=Candidatus Synechococcus calcipolaris G9 TaxID=1497997 RepID=A0ABT6F087_9SYNE|nr:alpha/beta hydrolase [Candidatus Synechococcus calcipolaris]MDG2991237.1 alpha/beta hydrolase [Candidatus Synechococcus calcipolaris G9]
MIGRWLGLALSGAIAGGLGMTMLGMARPGIAAEDINLVLGSDRQAGIVLPVADLRTFAETGVASSKLQALLSFASPEQQTKFRQLFTTVLPITPQTLDQGIDSTQADEILGTIAAATFRPDEEGIEALKVAVEKAADASEGLTLLTLLEAYPAEQLDISIVKMQELMEAHRDVIPNDVPQASDF